MEEIGQRERALVAGAPVTLAACALALGAAACVVAWPFAIDDAFIGIRYARHLVAGDGYVWNVGGPSTDGVTPLPWAFLLAPVARAAPVVVLLRAKALGALVFSATAAVWGLAVGRARAPMWAKISALVLLAVDLPVAAHAVSGMETSVAMALATLAAIAYRRPRTAATLAGLAATLRPELAVWSVVLAAGFGVVRARASGSAGGEALTAPTASPLRPALVAAAIAVLPFSVCAAVRVALFGSPAPLSVLAKPSDLSHGLAYAVAALVLSLAPIVVAAPRALLRERGPALVIVLAAACHFAVIAAVGGDWMPYARLAAAVIPSLLFAFVLLSPWSSRAPHLARVLAALAVALWLVPRDVRALRQAGAERSAMIETAGPLLASSRRIAAVDIGWVSAVSEAAIVDLAGVTDPDVAALGGGHTSKRIDTALLLAKGPDVVVFYASALPSALADLAEAEFPRVVEARLARDPSFREHFAPTALLPLGARGAGYVVFTRR